MIKVHARYDEYAYRIAKRNIDPTIVSLNEGQWITLDNNGNVTISNGAKKSFICISSKRKGRDNVSSTGKATYLFGNVELQTDQIDKEGTYGYMVPLKVTTGGILTPVTAMTVNEATHAIEGDTPDKIVAYALGTPDLDGFLDIAIV